jgi:GNAT superfamily N-acetyltransferase
MTPPADSPGAVEVGPARPSEAPAIALLHQTHINKGFLSSLGPGFLKLMYEYIIASEVVIVARSGDEIAGFVSASQHTSGMMRRFIRTRGLKAIPLLLRFAFSHAFLKRVLETLFAPRKARAGAGLAEEIPELLSIVVADDYRGTPVAGLLLDALERDLRGSGFHAYKVIAGAGLGAANRFYEKNGFELRGTIEIHQGDVSNVYVKQLH